MSLLFHHLAGNTMLQCLFVKIWTSDEILSDSPGKMKWRIRKGAAGYCLKEKLCNLVYLWHLVQRFKHTHTFAQRCTTLTSVPAGISKTCKYRTVDRLWWIQAEPQACDEYKFKHVPFHCSRCYCTCDLVCSCATSTIWFPFRLNTWAVTPFTYLQSGQCVNKTSSSETEVTEKLCLDTALFWNMRRAVL